MKNDEGALIHSDSRVIQLVFTATLTLSAVLLFWVQPALFHAVD
jgi:hypothetical protein